MCLIQLNFKAHNRKEVGLIIAGLVIRQNHLIIRHAVLVTVLLLLRGGQLFNRPHAKPVVQPPHDRGDAVKRQLALQHQRAHFHPMRVVILFQDTDVKFADIPQILLPDCGPVCERLWIHILHHLQRPAV